LQVSALQNKFISNLHRMSGLSAIPAAKSNEMHSELSSAQQHTLLEDGAEKLE